VWRRAGATAEVDVRVRQREARSSVTVTCVIGARGPDDVAADRHGPSLHFRPRPPRPGRTAPGGQGAGSGLPVEPARPLATSSPERR
jgi:hypothetical protein